MVVHRLD